MKFGAVIRRFLCLLFILALAPAAFGAEALSILKPDSFSHYVEHFNAMEGENVTNFVSNANAGAWLSKEIPFFECPDREVEEMYYFRWWSFRKHLERTPEGFVFTEFLTRPMPISSALGHHIMEGRWLHDQDFIDDYIRYWLHDDNSRQQMHRYSSWLADALYQRYLVINDRKFITSQLTALTGDYQQWEQEHLSPNGLFWQFDVRDAMEESISGSRTEKNLRPTINSYMFGNAQAIALIAQLAGKEATAKEFDAKAQQLRELVQEKLWNPQDGFFEAVHTNGKLADVREEIGFIPWYFKLPKADPKFDAAWKQFVDPQGFSAPYGITTAERRHPAFRSHGYGHCEWDGAVWPFATSQTLGALANYLRDYKASTVSSRDYFDAFLAYVHSQHVDGKPYIGEYLDETTGQWIDGKAGRSRFYNHSTFADLVITGVVGLCPRADDTVKLSPLLPAATWSWFCLDGVKYHGHTLTIIWDKDGMRYRRGQGLIVLADGKEIARGNNLSELTARLP